jgi:hypothetical protein
VLKTGLEIKKKVSVSYGGMGISGGMWREILTLR